MRTTIIAAAMLAANMPTTSVHAQVACRYEVAATIQVPPCSLGDRQVYATAISPSGRYICGYYCQCLCNPYESFVYDMQTGVMFTIPRPPGIFTSEANDVTDAGWVVGSMGGTPGDFGYVYDYPAQTYRAMISPLSPDGSCAITGINSSNTVCGTRLIAPGPEFLTSAFIKTLNGPVVDFGLIDGHRTEGVGINDAGQVLVTQGADSSALIWNGKSSSTQVPQVTGGNGMWARAIGNQGEVIGSSLVFVPDTYRIPFVSWKGVTFALPRVFVGPTSTATARAINSHGVIVGLCAPTVWPLDPHPAIWWGDTAIDLRQRVISVPNVYLLDATAISDTGLIVCGNYGPTIVLRPVPGAIGDTNCDAVVDRYDLLEVIADWGFTQSNADVNGDGVVNVADLLKVIIHWTY